MENNNKLFVIPVDMENRDSQDIARDASKQIVLLMDQLMKQMNGNREQQKHKEQKKHGTYRLNLFYAPLRPLHAAFFGA